jgi:hypothetical protein
MYLLEPKGGMGWKNHGPLILFNPLWFQPKFHLSFTVFTYYWRSATVGDLVRLRSSYVPIYMNGNFRQGINQKHGLINYIDTKAKCRHLKKWICKGTLRQMFIRVYGLEIQSIMLVFSTQLCELLPLQLLSGSTLPLSTPPPSSLCE